MSRKRKCVPMSDMYCCCMPEPQPMCCCMPQPQPVCCCAPQPQPVCCTPQPQPVCCCAPQNTCGNKTKSACSFPCLIILILILLVFGKSGRSCDDPCAGGNKGFGMDIGILFIIALFYLCCASPCAC